VITSCSFGENIDDLLIALLPDRPKHDNLHLLERIDLHRRRCVDLTRFKVAGILPTLALNISNSKYNGLIRIINASIPNFEREAGTGSDSVKENDNATKSPHNTPKTALERWRHAASF